MNAFVRPCLPEGGRWDSPAGARHYATVARAIDFIRDNVRRQPTLEEIAAAVHLSPFHLQRVFSEWAGLSPKRFLQYLTKEQAKVALGRSGTVLAAADAVGLSSASRLHDLMITSEAMTPGEIQSGGANLEIGFGRGDSPFGEVLLAWTARGLCHFGFVDAASPGPEGLSAEDSSSDRPEKRAEAQAAGQSGERFVERFGAIAEARARDPVAVLARAWPRAQLQRDDAGARAWLHQIFPTRPDGRRIHLLLRGSNFQIKVWEALIRTRPGELLSYGGLAHRIGHPGAQRAVGTALSLNNIGYLIPCHRVIQASGEVGQYRWRTERKWAMQVWEHAHSMNAPDEIGPSARRL